MVITVGTRLFTLARVTARPRSMVAATVAGILESLRRSNRKMLNFLQASLFCQESTLLSEIADRRAAGVILRRTPER